MPNPFGNPLSLPHGRPRKHPLYQRTSKGQQHYSEPELDALRVAAKMSKVSTARFIREAALYVAELVAKGQARPIPESLKKQQRKKYDLLEKRDWQDDAAEWRRVREAQGKHC